MLHTHLKHGNEARMKELALEFVRNGGSAKDINVIGKRRLLYV